MRAKALAVMAVVLIAAAAGPLFGQSVLPQAPPKTSVLTKKAPPTSSPRPDRDQAPRGPTRFLGVCNHSSDPVLVAVRAARAGQSAAILSMGDLSFEGSAQVLEIGACTALAAGMLAETEGANAPLGVYLASLAVQPGGARASPLAILDGVEADSDFAPGGWPGVLETVACGPATAQGIAAPQRVRRPGEASPRSCGPEEIRWQAVSLGYGGATEATTDDAMRNPVRILSVTGSGVGQRLLKPGEAARLGFAKRLAAIGDGALMATIADGIISGSEIATLEQAVQRYVAQRNQPLSLVRDFERGLSTCVGLPGAGVLDRAARLRGAGAPTPDANDGVCAVIRVAFREPAPAAEVCNVTPFNVLLALRYRSNGMPKREQGVALAPGACVSRQSDDGVLDYYARMETDGAADLAPNLVAEGREWTGEKSGCLDGDSVANCAAPVRFATVDASAPRTATANLTITQAEARAAGFARAPRDADNALTMALQIVLQAVGKYEGPLDGSWTSTWQGALTTYLRQRVETISNTDDRAVMRSLMAQVAQGRPITAEMLETGLRQRLQLALDQAMADPQVQQVAQIRNDLRIAQGGGGRSPMARAVAPATAPQPAPRPVADTRHCSPNYDACVAPCFAQSEALTNRCLAALNSGNTYGCDVEAMMASTEQLEQCSNSCQRQFDSCLASGR